MRIHLTPQGVHWPGGGLAGSLLPRLLAALRRAHAAGQARPERPCTRADLRQQLGLRELHRTQLWRALARLDGTPLAGLVQGATRSSGPYWLDAAALKRLSWEEAALLPAAPESPPAAAAMGLPLAYVHALSGADHLLDRGDLIGARHHLTEAAACAPPADAGAQLAVHARAARIARRMGDWAALHTTLRAMRRLLGAADLDALSRRQFTLRVAVLDAWHCHASLGHADAALRQLEALDEQVFAGDAVLLGDWLNVRALARRDVALARRDAALGTAALADLARALRAAALAGQPDALQVSAANLANTLHLLGEGGLYPADATRTREAVRWLLCSEAVCARWQLAEHSLLGAIFLLHIAIARPVAMAELRLWAAEADLAWDAGGWPAWAAARWAQCRRVHAQLPDEQRCAFLLLWCQHCLAADDAPTARTLLAEAAHHVRKLRAGARRARYDAQVQALTQRLSPP